MNKNEIIEACITLVTYALENRSTGADLIIDTPNGKLQFTYDFTMDLNNQEENN